MVYQWKIPVAPVSAQTAGEELERLYRKHGKLDPADVVEESRDASAPLHGCFEWNDAIAAEKYRVHHAAMLAELLASAEKEMTAFQRKYETLQELSPVMDAIRAYQQKTA